MIKAKKKFGQNFLIDPIIIYKILQSVNPLKTQSFLEIGAGKGALTRALLNKVKMLDSVELDRDLIPELKKLAFSVKNLRIKENNILNIRLNKKPTNKLRVIGNLPYNISSQIMLWSFENSESFQDIHYMFQREFGERLLSSPGKKSYGRLSVLTQYMFQAVSLFLVPPESFKPRPSVESIFIKFIPKPEKKINSKEAIMLQKVTKLLFAKRRKKISKTFKDLLPLNKIIDLKIDPDNRPESLSLKDFLKITTYLLKRKSG